MRIAASSYLNTAPLIWSFRHGPKQGVVELVEAVPARCAQMLADAEVDAALVPVIEFQRIPDISLVPDVCVGSKKQVRSVVLVSKLPQLGEVRSVALDESSRTSAALVKIIFNEFLRMQPRWTTHSPDLRQMLDGSDAALIIGDPAMTFPRQGLKVWDMATLWQKYTGFGFVFAMWMIRNESVEKFKSVDFARVRDDGLKMRNEIVAYYKREIPLTTEDLEQYLTHNITFTIDNSMEQGLALYFSLAQKHRLIENVKPLVFMGTSGSIASGSPEATRN